MESAADDTIVLVAGARQGDMEAFRKLYEKIYEGMYRYALSIMKNSYDAEDAVSDTVLAACRSIGGLKDAAAFKSWIYTILNNKCRRIYRNRKHDGFLSGDVISEMYDAAGGSACRNDIEENMVIRKIYGELDYDTRVIISLSVFAGFTSEEISGIVHKKPGTVRAIKSRALSRLKSELERNGIYEK